MHRCRFPLSLLARAPPSPAPPHFLIVYHREGESARIGYKSYKNFIQATRISSKCAPFASVSSVLSTEEIKLYFHWFALTSIFIWGCVAGRERELVGTFSFPWGLSRFPLSEGLVLAPKSLRELLTPNTFSPSDGWLSNAPLPWLCIVIFSLYLTHSICLCQL